MNELLPKWFLWLWILLSQFPFPLFFWGVERKQYSNFKESRPSFSSQRIQGPTGHEQWPPKGKWKIFLDRSLHRRVNLRQPFIFPS
jgi:hypothetical protein